MAVRCTKEQLNSVDKSFVASASSIQKPGFNTRADNGNWKDYGFSRACKAGKD